MRRKAFNSQIFLEFVCYTTFAVVLFQLVKSGEYLSYVTPKMEPYLNFTVIVMLIWSCYGLRRLFRPQYKTRSTHCFVLAIPILLLLLPHNSISASNLSTGYMGGNALANLSGEKSYDFSTESAPLDSTPAESAPINNLDSEPSQSESSTGDSPDDNSSDDTFTYPMNPDLKTQDHKIIVEDEDYYSWFTELFNDMEKYDGYQITIKGFVFKDPEIMKENEFIPARLMMSCCVADLTPAGIICQYDKVSELKEDTWVTVEGVIYIGEYMGYDEPQIKVTKISPAEKPKQEYIYP